MELFPEFKLFFIFLFLLYIGNNFKAKKKKKRKPVVRQVQRTGVTPFTRGPIKVSLTVSIIFFVAKGSNPVSHIALSCHVSLIFNLLQFLSLSLTLLTWIFLKISDHLLCPMFSHDEAQVMYACWARKYHSCVLIASYPVVYDTNFSH